MAAQVRRFINLTDIHDVVIHDESMGDQEVVIQASGKVARVDNNLVRLEGFIDAESGCHIPVIGFANHYVWGLPPPQEGVIFIVSKEVREALPHRKDLVSPDTKSPRCRRDGGKLRSVPGFVINL